MRGLKTIAVAAATLGLVVGATVGVAAHEATPESNDVGTMATSHHWRALRSVTLTSHDTCVAPVKVCLGVNQPVE